MPDWSYRTLLRPLLFALPCEQARRLTLRALAGIAKAPAGGQFIDLLGHMRADPRLASEHLAAAQAPACAEWRESAAWHRGLWGQLLFVSTGIGLVGAGAVITYIGCSDVFVQTDLEFMRTTAAELLVAHESLVPLVAHDRASLGGMLIANGIVVLLCALWGMRAGERWLWNALAWGGTVAFVAAIGVHYWVGYESLFHLAPGFTGFVVWWLALLLTRQWLCIR